MRLQILDLAKNDLIEGYHFYESKEEGLGNYFLVNLYSDIESLKLFGGIHRKVYRGLRPPRSLQEIPVCNLLHARREYRSNQGRGRLSQKAIVDQAAPQRGVAAVKRQEKATSLGQAKCLLHVDS
jgi:hypothetical protein